MFCVYYYYSHGIGVNHTHEKKRLISDERKKSILYKNQTIYNDFCFETIKMKRLVGSNLVKNKEKRVLISPYSMYNTKSKSGFRDFFLKCWLRAQAGGLAQPGSIDGWARLDPSPFRT